MKKIKLYFIMLVMMVFGAFIFTNNWVDAAIDNFKVEGVTTSTINDTYTDVDTGVKYFPFEDSNKDDFDVIKSTNEGVVESISELTITYSGIGEVSFDYMVSSEFGWDDFHIYVNDNREPAVMDSGLGEWKSFKWYNGDANATVTITIKYIKDISNNQNDDCCYLKNISFDETMYTPLLQVNLDNNNYTDNFSNFVYFGSGAEYTGVMTLSSLNADYELSDYKIEVIFNGNDVAGKEYSYNLKEQTNYNVSKNSVSITYSYGKYKTQSFTFYYNADLSEVISGEQYGYENDVDNPFVLIERGEEGNKEKVISSTNEASGTTSSISFGFEGSGQISFDYLVSGKEDFDFIKIYVDGLLHTEVSGVMAEFANFTYSFYGGNQTNIITVEYCKLENQYVLDDENAIYLKNISILEYDYVDVPSVSLNGSVVEDGETIVLSKTENAISLGEMAESVNVSIYLGYENALGESVTETIFTSEVEEGKTFTGNKQGPHNFTISADVNTIVISFSAENSVPRSMTFYIVKEAVEDVFIFDNDEENPFVRTVVDNEAVIKTNIEGKDSTQTTISYTAVTRGEITVEYKISTEDYDYLVIKVNDTEVLRDSGDKSWQMYIFEVKASDVVTISYIKDAGVYYGYDCVYFRKISFEEKNYATVVSATLNDNPINEDTKVIYFDWGDHDSALRFAEFTQYQSVVVEINGNVVNPSEGIYALNLNLQQNNVISITYSEIDPNGVIVYNSVVLTFEYNARLISSDVVGYNPTVYFQSKNIKNENVVTLNSGYSYFSNAILELKVTGKGFFKFDYKYFTYDNLNVTVCFDDKDCRSIIDEDNNDTWTTLGYSFENEGNHIIEVIVNSRYFYGDVDYLYLKNFKFYYFDTLIGKISGDGKENSPYDFSDLVDEMNKIGLSYFNHRIYNNTSITNLFINDMDGYVFVMNDKEVVAGENESKINATIFEVGESTLLIGNGTITVTVYFANQGLAGTTITVGFGSEEKPYEITDETQLIKMSDGLQYCYKLMNNITLTSAWIPLGNEDNPFTGCLNGNNNTINGLNISSEEEFVGLIGYGVNAKVYDLIIESPVISGTNVVGTVFGIGENIEVKNVTINNATVSIVEGENNNLIVGGVVGGALESKFDDVQITGNVTSLSAIQAYIGGFVGGLVGGEVLNSSTSVNVTGYGYIGALLGYTEEGMVSVSNTTISGNVISNNSTSINMIGVVSTNFDRVTATNVKHKISGSYTYAADSVTIVGANLYGIGLSKEGFEVTLNEGTFNVDVILSSGSDILDGVRAGINGYVIRFEMSDGTYRYYELFDFNNYSIISTNVNINVNSLTGYQNNFASMEVEEGIVIGDVDQSCAYVTVKINNVIDLIHASYVVNYGIPTTFKTYYIYGIYNSTISFLFNSDLKLDNNYKGLGNSFAYPYKGLISGGDSKHTITFNINKGNSVSVGLVNYYSNGDIEPRIENLKVEGSVTGGLFAGLVGFYRGSERVWFVNVENHATYSAQENVGSLVAYSEYGRIHVENCVNYSEFSYAAFIGTGNVSVEYGGINKNYGEYKGEEKKNIYMIFFGTSNALGFASASLENYYVLDVKAEGITLNFKEIKNVSGENANVESVQYTSDANGKIIFKMGTDNLYNIVIFGGLLKEKEYVLNTNFRGELLVPKSITLADDNNFHSNGSNNWDLKAEVVYYGDTSAKVNLVVDLTRDILDTNELVLDDVVLTHEAYVIEDFIVDLTRYTDDMLNYKNLFIEINEASEGFKEIAQSIVNGFYILESIYNGEETIVSESSITMYNDFIRDNNIGETQISEWLEKIVDYITLVGDSVVVYGQEATFKVQITYLSGDYEQKDIVFDYGLDDIVVENESKTVKITSIENFISQKDSKVVYDQKLEFVVELVNKEVKAKVEISSFEYSGVAPVLNVYLDLGTNKFNDVVSNLEFKFLNDQSKECTPVNVGSYSINIINYKIVNRDYYDVLDLSLESLVITPKVVDIVWNEESESNYNGQDKFGIFSAYYKDVNDLSVVINLETIEMINAGEYTLTAMIEDNNYVASEETRNKQYVINKLNVQLEIGDYSINYGESLGDISVVVSGSILSSDNQGTYYSALKNDVYYDINDLGSGSYVLIPSFNNEEILITNYNINKVNGSLTVIGLDTKIVAEDVTYIYKGRDYSFDNFNNKVYDINDNLIYSSAIRYEYTKDDEPVSEAIDVGTYTVKVIFDGDGNYNPSEKTITLVITPYIVNIDWEYEGFNNDYDGTNKIGLVKAYYHDVYGIRQAATLNIDTMVNAGTYDLVASTGNDNYVVHESSLNRQFVINKLDLNLVVGDYTMDYHANLPTIEVSVEGLLESDNAGVAYKVVKNNVEYDTLNPLDSGLYNLIPVLNNEDDVVINYNINKVNGTLTVEGVETRIVANDISYEYNGSAFVMNLDNVEVYDDNDTKVENPTIEYTITKEGQEVESVIDAGVYSVKLLFAGNQNYGYCEKTISLTVNPKEVDLVWKGTYESEYSGEDKFSADIIASYKDVNDEDIVVAIEVIEMINAGEYTLVSQIIDSNYTASAETKNKIYKINKLNVDVEIGNYSINYGEDLPTINVSVTGLLQQDTSVVTYNIVRNSNVYDKESVLDSGSYTLVGILSNEESIQINYNINKVNGTLTIIGVETTIVSDDFTYRYNGNNFAPDFSGVEVYDLDDTKVIDPTFTYIIRKDLEVVSFAKDVGEYTVEICFEGQGRFAASSLVVNLTISPSDLTIKINNASSEYGDGLAELTYTLVEGDLYNYDSIDVTLNKADGNSIGKYIISGVNNNPNYNVEFINGEYEITKRNITISIDDKSSLYLDSLEELTYTVFEGSILSGDDLNIVLSKQAGDEVGVYTINGSYSNELYNVNFISGIYTIEKIDITGIVFENVITVYNGSNVEFGVSSLELSDGSMASVEYYFEDGRIASDLINAGEYNVIARLTNKNYNTLELTATIVINRANIVAQYDSTIQVEYEEEGYDYQFVNDTFEDGREATVVYVVLKDNIVIENIVNIGTYIVVAQISDSEGNYFDLNVMQTVRVVKKQITIEYSTEAIIYNGNAQYPIFDNSEEYILSFNTSDGSVPVDAGTYVMNVSHPNTNYHINNSSIEYNIEKLAIVLGATNTYEYTGQIIQTDINITNKIANDDIKVTFEYYLNNLKIDQIKDAGDYTIKAVSLSGESSNNYMIDEDEFALRVNPKKIIVKPTRTSKVYGDADPVLTYTLSEELYGGLQVSGSLTREAGEDAGSYLFNVETLVATSNYEFVLEQHYEYFYIVAKEIEVEVGETTFEYDGTEKRLQIIVSEGATVEYEGDMVNVGTYTVKIKITNNNYRLPMEYEDIIVTITKKNISSVISIEKTEYLYNGQRITPNISCGNYGCEITYKKNSEVVTEIKEPGVYDIIVLIENETEKGEVTYKLTVNKMSSQPKQVTMEIHYNRIIVEKDDTLEYKLDTGEYYSSNEFNGLRAAYKYTISVRRKETAYTSASEPIVYEVFTTNNPSAVHELIDKLTEEINEENLKVLKEINKELKKVNQADVDINRYGRYKDIKNNFETIMNSYEDNLENSHKVFNFIEGKVMLFNLIVSLMAFIVLKRRINNV